MKIIVTGSLGHISKPLTEELVQKGHKVTVISSNPERQKEIEELKAVAAIGLIEDVDFLTRTFSGADAAYCMIPPSNGFFDPNFDIIAFSHKIGNNYKQAVQQSGVKKMVFLSSIGAHTDKGNGILRLYHIIENILNELPPEVAITFMRPVAFYYNFYGYVDTIKTQNIIAANMGGDSKRPFVSPIDIAAAVAEELVTPFEGRKVRYVASEEISCNEVAAILGTAIGKPDLKWVIISDEQMQKGMIAAGMNPEIAAGLVEMNASAHSGKLCEDYYRHRPVLGKVKVKDFAKEFAAAFK